MYLARLCWAIGLATMGLALVATPASAVDTIPGTFESIGPTGIFEVPSLNLTPGQPLPYSGAITAVLPEPGNPDHLLVGAVGGGVWRTTDALDSPPHFEHLTDREASLSIGALSYDPTDGDHQTILAGTGNRSAFAGSGLLTGLLRTTDGGATWTSLSGSPTESIAGNDISGVQGRGAVIVVASRSPGGVFRSHDGGATFNEIDRDLTGDPASTDIGSGPAYDLVGDPDDPDRLYAAIGGASGGVFVSDDVGRHWSRIAAPGDFVGEAGQDVITPATNLRLSVRGAVTTGDARPERLVYAFVANPAPLPRPPSRSSSARESDRPDGEDDGGEDDGGEDEGQAQPRLLDAPGPFAASDADRAFIDVLMLAATPRRFPVIPGAGSSATKGSAAVALYRSANGGATWTSMDLPDVNPKGQAGNDLSVAASPNADDVVYVAGDGNRSTSASDGQIFRCSARTDPGSQCSLAVRGGTADFTSPHGDSRAMAFDANGRLLEADDGGLYARPRPDDLVDKSNWHSLNGFLTVGETHSCAWDSSRQTALCGLQDTGVAEQRESDAEHWGEVEEFDGNTVAISDGLPGSSSYYSIHNLQRFTLRRCPPGGGACTISHPAALVGGGPTTIAGLGGPIYEATATDPKCPSRVLVSPNDVLESTDSGENFTDLTNGAPRFGAPTLALVTASTGCSDPNAVTYFGSVSGLWRRDGGGGFQATGFSAASGGAQPVAVALHRGAKNKVWAATANRVYASSDGGGAWRSLSGPPSSAGAIYAIARIPGAETGITAIGTRSGVYISDDLHPTQWSQLTLKPPSTPARSLEYDPADDVLLVGTMGRGAWKLANASAMDLAPAVTKLPPRTGKEGSAMSATGGWDDPDRARLDEVTATVDYGEGDGAQPLTLGSDGTFALSHAYADNGSYRVTVALTDAAGARSQSAAVWTVGNVAPTLGAIDASPPTGPAGPLIEFSVPFTDPGELDTHTAVLRAGDTGEEVAATITGTNTSGTASASYVFKQPGRFTMTFTVRDKDGGARSRSRVYVVR